MSVVRLSIWALGFSLVAGACAGGNDGGVTDEPDATPRPDGFRDPEPRPLGCDHVDLLFAIDASFSMQEEITALSGTVFPELARRLEELGQGSLQDFRIGVIDACPNPATLHTVSNDRDAEDNPIDCAFESGQPWMDSTSSNLENEFGCVTNMYTDDFETVCLDPKTTPGGVSDQDERPAYAAWSALTDPNASGANAGFLRDNALLVVVAITDEDEELGLDLPDQTNDPQVIFDNLVSIKGDVKDMVFLGIGGQGGCEEGEYGTALDAFNLKSVTDMFIAEDRGVYWDLCSGRLEDGITEAMNVISKGCNIIN